MLLHLALALTAAAVDDGSCVIERNVRVPMRDGVQLAADLYFPARHGVRIEGRFPAVLERTPYNKEAAGRNWGRFFARHGYVGIVQDTRGRYASEGVWTMLTGDVADGYDTAAWIVRQPWSDGGFGTLGTSYCGGVQHALALSNPPGLKAMIPADAVANAGYYGMRYGGAFELRFFNWIFMAGAPGSNRVRADPSTRAALEEAFGNVRQYLVSLPLRRGLTPLRLAPAYEDWLAYAMEHGENDAYWKQPGLGVVDQVERYQDTPVYLIGGWYDSWALPTTMSYTALAKRQKSPQKMILGPWIHGAHDRSAHGVAEFGPQAAIPALEFRLRWFDRWLKGAANGVERDAPVKIFVMGGGSEEKTAGGLHLHGGAWRDEREWPLERTRFTPYYLHPDGALGPQKPGVGPHSVAYDFDPRDPVPSIGGATSSGNSMLQQGAWDQKCDERIWNCKDRLPLSARRDVLVFQTAPLERDIEVTGPIEVRLWASSSAPDTDFTAKLIDVHPPTRDFPSGIDMILGDGVRRARFRNSLERQELMRPGTVYRIDIQLYPTSNVFRAGHRIRLDVSSSNFPRFDVNPNTGEALNRHRRMATAVNTIYFDAARPSHVVLPVIPR